MANANKKNSSKTYLLTEKSAMSLKGQSHEKVFEFLTWDGSFSLN
jgi:hypothetical protein